MKAFFVLLSVAIGAMWLLALVTEPESDFPDRTIIYWSTDENPARREQIEPFMEINPDLAVVVEPTSFEKTIIQCSTGIGPDVIEIYSQADLVAYAEAGILLDLTPYQDRFRFKPESTFPRMVGVFTYKGRQYGYPANVAAQVLFYNKRLFREAGIPEPTDAMVWEDLIDLIRPLTVRREDGKGFRQFAMLLPRFYVNDVHLQFGASIFNEDKTHCVLDSPESIRAMQFYYDLMTEYQVVPTPMAADSLSGEGGWGTGEIRWFANGRGATMWGSRWMLVQFRQYPAIREEIGCVILPRPEGGDPACYVVGRTPGINRNSKNIEEALRFLDYLASPEYSEIVAMGADALPPNADYAADPRRLLNPEYPWENYQEKFVESMKYARPQEVSPFVDPKIVARIWDETLEIIENGLQTPEEALATAASRINRRIERNVRERPDLREEYERRTGGRLPAEVSLAH